MPKQKEENANNKRKNSLAHNAPYHKGTGGIDGSLRLAYTKPPHMQNKALVISGFNRNIQESTFKQIVNERAEREIEFKYIQRLDRTFSKWGTVVIELNDKDYETLSNLDFWEADMKIRQWKGLRFWRDETRPVRVKPHEVGTYMRRQWTT